MTHYKALSIVFVIAFLFLHSSIVCTADNGIQEVPLASSTNNAPFTFSGTKNILFVLDASDSMSVHFEMLRNGEPRLKLDREKLLFRDLLKQVPGEINCGLRVFGGNELSQLPTCRQTELVLPCRRENREKISDAVRNIQCAGRSPIEYALLQVFDNDLRNIQDRTVVILMTDGTDSCGGEPCRFAASLPGNKLKANIVVVLFNDRRRQSISPKIKCLADASNGKLYDRDSFQALINV
jgi:Ca-activated chloride channel homolog